jgi:cobalt-zinc-cadmium efflux system membrane fusion protein
MPQADSPGGGARAASARIDFVAPVLDPHTRTARARATLANDDGSFRLNSRVMVRVALASGGGASVPIAALQRIAPHDVVFVRRAPDEFELRRVSVTSRDADRALVSAGLAGGEPIATTGSFLLKTEVQKASIGSGCCEVE